MRRYLRKLITLDTYLIVPCSTARLTVQGELRMRGRYLIAAVLAVILVTATAAGLYFNRPSSEMSSTQVQVVAAENFWGSLVSQLGGTHTQVLSIVSDPNAHPHEYESNASNDRTIANVNLVIVNDAGYDHLDLRLILTKLNNYQ